MIARMLKVFIVARQGDRDRLLEALRGLGVVHLAPVDPQQATPEERTASAIDQLSRAIQVLSAVEPAGERREVDPLQAAGEVLHLQRESAELRSRLGALHRQIEQLAVWGDVPLEQFEALREAGVELRFFAVPAAQVDAVRAQYLHVLHPLPGKRVLVAVMDAAQPEVPDGAEPLPLPARDRPSIRAEAAEIDAALKAGARRLGELAYLVGDLKAELARRNREAEYTVALRGGLAGPDLFALQGWVPAERAEGLSAGLRRAGLPAAVRTDDPAPGDDPPTLIQYPRWARPIQGLFDMLGTLPGYREIDVSGFFMIALPVFAAMLIGDAGYGLILLLAPALMYRKAVAIAGRPGVNLLMIVGAATMVWGLLSGQFFGVSPRQLEGAGGALASVGHALAAVQIIGGSVQDQAFLIMKISFVMAAIHLSLAQLRQALMLAPRVDMLSKIGWAVFLWGIFLLIWYLFFQSPRGRPPHPATPYLLLIGTALAILFSEPTRNPARMLGLGVARFPLTALGTFSDSLSYIRLMGVGLASTIIAQTFNSLGAQVAGGATWIAGGLVALFGHALNLAMCMIAVLAHGVRLNMLEFSNNVGVQWAGHPYEPFRDTHRKER